ncbi:hypothetical protein I5484_06415 [Citrobacter freundii]|uniref:hypothetical protein n=1 Tax=Citrobacter TaxID=544 RepID=UPI000D5967E1|nr:hypothetical protein [Citrobacter freundii]EBH7424271.1 hypothetical protein [Salmonella enterica]ECC3108098.1 hypothetical protein [Salmonella enterica subsp. enterica]ECO0115424.1 hypothetical protein [Salmonella enterica subsp. enterica serovar Schwarzengrund]EEJ9167354.1 hypothetical protein [Salmonella enterica subsp. enterica serovar Typhimurium]EDF9497058.1 hypothetical protein [Salmonella enterica]
MKVQNIITSKETHNVTAKTNLGYLIACCGVVKFHVWEMDNEYFPAVEDQGGLVVNMNQLPINFGDIELVKIRQYLPPEIDMEGDCVLIKPKEGQPLYEVEEVSFYYRDIQMLYDGQHLRAATKDSEVWNCMCCKDSGIERTGTDIKKVQAALRHIRKLIM